MQGTYHIKQVLSFVLKERFHPRAYARGPQLKFDSNFFLVFLKGQIYWKSPVSAGLKSPEQRDNVRRKIREKRMEQKKQFQFMFRCFFMVSIMIVS